MSSGNAKELRKATRQVVTEILPDILQTEVFKGLADKLLKDLAETVIARLQLIETDIQNKLIEMEARQRDVLTFTLNQAQANKQPIVNEIS